MAFRLMGAELTASFIQRAGWDGFGVIRFPEVFVAPGLFLGRESVGLKWPVIIDDTPKVNVSTECEWVCEKPRICVIIYSTRHDQLIHHGDGEPIAWEKPWVFHDMVTQVCVVKEKGRKIGDLKIRKNSRRKIF